MRIIITSDDGEALDSDEITREEYDNLTSFGAYTILTGMSIGDAR